MRDHQAEFLAFQATYARWLAAGIIQVPKTEPVNWVKYSPFWRSWES